MNRIDTYKSTIKNLAAFILGTTVASEITDHRKRDLARDAEGANRSGHFYLDFARALVPATERGRHQADVHMTVSMEGHRPVADEEGNLWYEHAIKVEVSWPSYGTEDLVFCKTFMQLLDDVLALGRAIEHEFSAPIWQLYMTAEQIAAEKEATENSRRKTELAKTLGAIIGHGRCRHMHVGTVREFTTSEPQWTWEVPVGEHHIAAGVKQFKITMNVATARIERTA